MTLSGGFYEANRPRQKLKGSDLYVVRLLPEGRRIQGSAERDPSRLGQSKPCLRCLRALEAAGVRRVIFSTGGMADGGAGHELRTVHELLREATHTGGHCSRGDADTGKASGTAR